MTTFIISKSRGGEPVAEVKANGRRQALIAYGRQIGGGQLHHSCRTPILVTTGVVYHAHTKRERATA